MFDPKILLDKGWEAVRSHQLEEACDLFAQSVAEARFVPDPTLLISALMALGAIESDLQHPSKALESFREASTVSECAASPARQAEALIEAAKILRRQRKNTEAAGICDQILSLFAPASNEALLPRARALRVLARIKEDAEDAANSEELILLWQAAATLYEAAGEQERLDECKSQIAFLLGQ